MKLTTLLGAIALAASLAFAGPAAAAGAHHTAISVGSCSTVLSAADETLVKAGDLKDCIKFIILRTQDRTGHPTLILNMGSNSAQGPAGVNGSTGAKGDKGDKGDTGATGPQGPAGADGQDGQDGKDGADGATGPQGPAGADGAQGPAGPQGPKGNDGHCIGICIGH